MSRAGEFVGQHGAWGTRAACGPPVGLAYLGLLVCAASVHNEGFGRRSSETDTRSSQNEAYLFVWWILYSSRVVLPCRCSCSVAYQMEKQEGVPSRRAPSSWGAARVCGGRGKGGKEGGRGGVGKGHWRDSVDDERAGPANTWSGFDIGIACSRSCWLHSRRESLRRAPAVRGLKDPPGS